MWFRIAMSKSLPKWLCLAEGAVRTLRVFEHGCDAGLLTARKTTGSECLLGAAFTLLAAGVMSIDETFGSPSCTAMSFKSPRASCRP